MVERPTLSPNWNRVDKLTPRLQPQVDVRRQILRGEPWYVLHDPIGNNFFRINPIGYHFIGLLDGRRTVDEAWRMTLQKHGDAAPTQNEVVGLLSQLNQSNLLRVDLPADARPLLARTQQRRAKLWGGQLLNVLFLRIPLFNPQPIIDWLSPLVRPLLSRVGLVMWFAWLGYCLAVFLPHFEEFLAAADPEMVLAPANMGWMTVLFIILKAIHELGHGLMNRRFGGVTPETGIMLLVLFPAPYVDTTSSWKFDSKWKRLLVAAAGMLFELAIAAGAAVVWVRTEAGLVNQLAYNVVFLASITTILFNANPLLRFDGYYILTDLIETPNLYDRSRRHLLYLLQRYAYNFRGAQPVSSSPSETPILVVYGIAAFIYRILLLSGIILFIAGKFFTVGVMLAAWSFIAWVIVPLGKGVRYLVTNPGASERRVRAWGVTLGSVAVVIAALGLIPVDEHRRLQGVVESSRQADVVVYTQGEVAELLVEPGDHVDADQPVARLDNAELRTRALELRARLAEAEARLAKAWGEQDVVNRQIAQTDIAMTREALRRVEDQLAELTIRSPQAGWFIAAPGFRHAEGRTLERGQKVGRVVDLTQLRVTAMLSQSQHDAQYVEALRRVELRPESQPHRVLESEVLYASQAGTYVLPHPALGYSGGGLIALAPTDEQGVRAARPHFELRLSLPDEVVPVGPGESAEAGLAESGPRFGAVDAITAGLAPADSDDDGRPLVLRPGERVHVRLTLANKRPLLFQYAHRLRQLLRDSFMI